VGQSQSASHSISSSRALRGMLGGAVLSFATLASCGGGLGDEDYVPEPRAALNAYDLNNPPFCVGTCEPDYGSQRTPDCEVAEAGIEFFPGGGLPDADVLNGDAGNITNFYSYNDNSSDFLVAGPIPFDPDAALANFQPPAQPVQDRCEPNENVHHIRGGLFREWGGGMGRRMVDMPTAAGCGALPAGEDAPAHCPRANPRFEDALAAMEDQNEAARWRANYYAMTLDLTGWDGISFWARSGPNNTGGIRVYVGDRQMDEDMAFLEMSAGLEPTCRRARECSCPNHVPCTLSDVAVSTGVQTGLANPWRCYDPAVEGPSLLAVYRQYEAAGRQGVFDEVYETCGPTLCDEDNPSFGTMPGTAPDPEFATVFGKQCLPYKLVSDLEDSFCYDPNDPLHPPPDGPQRCGDGWAKGVALTADWQFFKIPFTELRQEGYGKPFPNLDLSAITLVRFTWTQGWVDVWLDDVRFYRQLSNAPQSE
jgi:hypothetical protein